VPKISHKPKPPKRELRRRFVTSLLSLHDVLVAWPPCPKSELRQAETRISPFQAAALRTFLVHQRVHGSVLSYLLECLCSSSYLSRFDCSEDASIQLRACIGFCWHSVVARRTLKSAGLPAVQCKMSYRYIFGLEPHKVLSKEHSERATTTIAKGHFDPNAVTLLESSCSSTVPFR